MNIFNKKHTMIGIQSLSLSQNAAIISLEYQEFTFENGLGISGKINIKKESAIENGGHVDKKIIKFWLDRPEKYKEQIINAIEMDEAFKKFNSEVGNKMDYLWGHGIVFQLGALNSAYDRLGMKPIWDYWKEMESRTMMKFLGVKISDIKPTIKDRTEKLIEVFTTE